MTKVHSRRALLGAGSIAGLVVLGAGTHAVAKKPERKTGAPKPEKKEGEKEKESGEDVGPGEDLMREHGVLRRVLLVYGEVSRRLLANSEVDPDALRKSAELVRGFVEDYHERQEEEVIFPRFEQARKLADLVRVLRAQHQAGRKLTDRVLAFSTPATLKDTSRRLDLRATLASFARMYEPHAAREDTVLFPALHEIVSRSEYDALGEELERREHAAFGERDGAGFGRAVAEIDAIEKTLGIEDLERFTAVT